MGTFAVSPRSNVTQQLNYIRWVPLGPGVSVSAAF